MLEINFIKFRGFSCFSVIARLLEANIKDAVAFAEGMSVVAHLLGPRYVPRWMGASFENGDRVENGCTFSR